MYGKTGTLFSVLCLVMRPRLCLQPANNNHKVLRLTRRNGVRAKYYQAHIPSDPPLIETEVKVAKIQTKTVHYLPAPTFLVSSIIRNK